MDKEGNEKEKELNIKKKKFSTFSNIIDKREI